jgi:hypothetical protein
MKDELRRRKRQKVEGRIKNYELPSTLRKKP